MCPVIDLHSHILAGLDDGPPETATSLAMARLWEADGVDTVVATPHLNLRYDVEPDGIEAGVETLNGQLRSEGIGVTVLAGGEVAVDRLQRLSDDEVRRLTLGSGDCVLLESPFDTNASYLDDAVFKLQLLGLRVLLAHPERSPLFQRQPDRLRRLVDHGALCSLTSGSMTGQFGSTARSFSVRLFRDGLVHNVASDAHDDKRRLPGLRAGFAEFEDELPGIAEQAPWFTQEVPAALLAGEPVPAAPTPPRPPRPGGRLLARLRTRR